MAISFDQRRLECLRLANNLATAKMIKPEEVITTAKQYCAYVDGDDLAQVDDDAFNRLKFRFNGDKNEKG